MDTKSDSNKKGISRRDFCKSTTLATSGILLSSLSVGASAYAKGSDMLKVAVIGSGSRGAGAVNNVLNTGDGVKLVAMADAFRDRLDTTYENLYKRFGDTGKMEVPEEHKFTGFEGYKQAIQLADVVILTAPPAFRPMHFDEAVRQGKQIFMEKPLATDAAGIKKILKTAEEAKRKKLNVVVGLQRHYQNSYREVAKRLEQDAIGKIVSGQVYWNSAGVWVRERKPEYTEMEYQMRNWYYFNWLCGDHIVEQHIHNIDVANWFIGEYPISAQGMGGREVRTGKEFGEIFDHHFVEFTYPGGAVVASQCRHMPNCWESRSETFQGTKGTVNTDNSDNAMIRDYNRKVLYNHDGMNDPSPYQQEIDEFIASIRNGNVIDDTENAAKSTMTAILGRMATYSGQLLTFDEALNSNQDLMPKRLAWDAEPPVLPDENGFYPIPVPGQTRII